MDGSALTTFAWVFMLVSMGAVTFLTVYCFYRILRDPGVASQPSTPPPAGPGTGAPGGHAPDS